MPEQDRELRVSVGAAAIVLAWLAAAVVAAFGVWWFVGAGLLTDSRAAQREGRLLLAFGGCVAIGGVWLLVAGIVALHGAGVAQLPFACLPVLGGIVGAAVAGVGVRWFMLTALVVFVVGEAGLTVGAALLTGRTRVAPLRPP